MARVTIQPLEDATVGAIVDRLRTAADELEAGAFEAGADWRLEEEEGDTRAWSDGLMGDAD